MGTPEFSQGLPPDIQAQLDQDFKAIDDMYPLPSPDYPSTPEEEVEARALEVMAAEANQDPDIVAQTAHMTPEYVEKKLAELLSRAEIDNIHSEAEEIAQLEKRFHQD